MAPVLTYYCFNCKEIVTTRVYHDVLCEQHHCSKCGLFLFSVSHDDPILTGSVILPEDPPDTRDKKK